VFKRGEAPLFYKIIPLSLSKERGTEGVRLPFKSRDDINSHQKMYNY